MVSSRFWLGLRKSQLPAAQWLLHLPSMIAFVATVVAWAWLEESLDPAQLLGGRGELTELADRQVAFQPLAHATRLRRVETVAFEPGRDTRRWVDAPRREEQGRCRPPPCPNDH